jgi:hypothetical protein
MRTMRAAVAVALVLLGACRGGDRAAAHDAAPPPADSSGQRFLIVTIRRIDIIDRHPEDGDVLPKRDPTPNGDSFDVHFASPDYGARAPDRRPEMHTYDVTIAVPEEAPTTFERTLDATRGFRWMLLARGWRVGDDGKVRLNAYEVANAQTRWGDGSGVGPNASVLAELALTPDRWAAVQVTRDQQRDFIFYELEELKYGPITATPPADAVRGKPEEPGLQNDRRLHWDHADNLMKVP